MLLNWNARTYRGNIFVVTDPLPAFIEGQPGIAATVTTERGRRSNIALICPGVSDYLDVGKYRRRNAAENIGSRPDADAKRIAVLDLLAQALIGEKLGTRARCVERHRGPA